MSIIYSFLSFQELDQLSRPPPTDDDDELPAPQMAAAAPRTAGGARSAGLDQSIVRGKLLQHVRTTVFFMV